MSVGDQAGDGKAGGERRIIPTLAVVSAVLILVFFAFAVWRMFAIAGDEATTDMHWSRVLFIYNALEAMAFAAAGVLLGERVQRSRAVAAEARADQAAERADEATESAARSEANGKALKAAVKAKQGAPGAAEAAMANPELNELSNLADRLFPD